MLLFPHVLKLILKQSPLLRLLIRRDGSSLLLLVLSIIVFFIRSIVLVVWVAPRVGGLLLSGKWVSVVSGILWRHISDNLAADLVDYFIVVDYFGSRVRNVDL